MTTRDEAIKELTQFPYQRLDNDTLLVLLSIARMALQHPLPDKLTRKEATK